jgi:hypothetical protein
MRRSHDARAKFVASFGRSPGYIALRGVRASPAAATLLKERPCPLLSSAAPGCRPQRLQRSRRFAVRGRNKKRPDLRARAENAQNCFLPFLLSTMTASAVLFLFNVIETKFLRASSTWEFSHSLDPKWMAIPAGFEPATHTIL